MGCKLPVSALAKETAIKLHKVPDEQAARVVQDALDSLYEEEECNTVLCTLPSGWTARC